MAAELIIDDMMQVVDETDAWSEVENSSSVTAAILCPVSLLIASFAALSVTSQKALVQPFGVNIYEISHSASIDSALAKVGAASSVSYLEDVVDEDDEDLSVLQAFLGKLMDGSKDTPDGIKLFISKNLKDLL